MDKSLLIIQSAFLSSREKMPHKSLFCGKIQKESDNAFAFFLVEICTNPQIASKIKKTILGLMEDRINRVDYINETFLESTINEINASLEKLIRSGVQDWVEKLNAIIGIISDDEISITQTGKISGYIFRKGKISSLTESNYSSDFHPAKTFSEIISGKLSPEDRVVFSNEKLFDHLSLDRIKKITENINAKETIFELDHFFKKIRVVDTNSIIISADTKEKIENVPINDLPEILYIDETEENPAIKIYKKYRPAIITGCKIAKLHTKKVYEFSKKNGKKIYHKSKKLWREKYGPKTEELFEKSKPYIKDAYISTKKVIGPNLSKLSGGKFKIKMHTYNRNSSFFSSEFVPTVIAIVQRLWKFVSNRDKRRYAYLILIGIFILFGYLKIHSNNVYRDQKKEQNEIVNSYDKAKITFNQAKENAALGKEGSLLLYEDALALAKKAQLSEGNKDKAFELYKEIQTSIDKTTNTTRFYNLVAKASFSSDIKKIALIGTSVYGVNSEGKIYSANTQDGDVKLIASYGKENGETKSVAYIEQSNKILFLTSANKIFSFDIETQVVTEQNLSDGSWNGVEKIAAFSSNIYAITNNNELLKYSGSNDNYSKGVSYANTKNAIKDAIDIGIDGSVYILKSSGTVTKFSRGSEDKDFDLTNVPATLTKVNSSAKIYTDENTNHLFILEKEQGKILRFDKTGAFVNQYALDNIIPDDFAVNGKLKKLVILANSSIYEIEL